MEITLPPIIRLENVHFTYPQRPQPALMDINLTIAPGEYVAIVGHNGSGKSTLAKLLNALLLPTAGNVWVKEWNTQDSNRLRSIRAAVGMVLQTPDNQLVATIVEEEVAFGPENLGVPHTEMVQRVDWALAQVGLLPHRHRAPHLLSAGQKQRVCLAGILAMRPEVLVLDESTAMLDPQGRRDVLAIAHRLNREEGLTVVAITHFMEEAVEADRVLVLSGGQIAMQGHPREVFGRAKQLRALNLDIPQVTQLALAVRQHLPYFPADILTANEFVTAARQHLSPAVLPTRPVAVKPTPSASQPIIEAKQLTHHYLRGTPLAVTALDRVSLAVHAGEVLGLLGHTGSGKSTLIQHFNALLRPHAGQVLIFGNDVSQPRLDVKAIRRQVGLVFQQPEKQLFEHYVGDDIAYGPRNLKLPREEVRARVQRAMTAVGLGFDEFKDRQTFGLSGGEMRRAALAGVLALEPSVLVLDEPTAGLDPHGRTQLIARLLQLRRDNGLTLVWVSHNMDELATVSDRLAVLSQGQVKIIGTPAEVFGQVELLAETGLAAPSITTLMERLHQAGLLADPGPVLTVEDAAKILVGA